MKPSVRKTLEFLLLLAVAAFSLLLFLNRESLQNVGTPGYAGVLGLCFLANATVFLPAPSLLVVVSCAQFLAPVPVALAGAIGSTLGELTGYLCGSAGQDLSPRFRSLALRMINILKRDWLLVFVLALLPLPIFDVAGICSGGSRMPVWKFLVACFPGKLLKMLAYIALWNSLAAFLPQV